MPSDVEARPHSSSSGAFGPSAECALWQGDHHVRAAAKRFQGLSEQALSGHAHHDGTLCLDLLQGRPGTRRPLCQRTLGARTQAQRKTRMLQVVWKIMLQEEIVVVVVVVFFFFFFFLNDIFLVKIARRLL